MPDSLSFAQRHVFATVIQDSIGDSHADFKIKDSINGVSRVRLHRDHWPHDKKWGSLNEGATVQLFLYNLSSRAREHGDSGHWFGSAIWANDELNPWHSAHTEHLKQGDIVQGTVLRLAGDSAVVRRDHVDGRPGLQEIFLRRQEVPSIFSAGSIETIFPQGLRVQGKVVSVDNSRCKCDFSIREWLSELQRQLPLREVRLRRHAQTPYMLFEDENVDLLVDRVSSEYHARSIAFHQQQVRPWLNHWVLLIDDDQNFARMLKAWMSQLGAQVWSVDNASAAKQCLENEALHCTHVLMDYGLGTRDNQAELLRLLKKYRHQKKVAVITGSPDGDSNSFSKRYELPLLQKPLDFDKLGRWLKGENIESDIRPEPGKLWRREVPALTDWMQRVDRWLGIASSALLAPGLLWVRAHEAVLGVHPLAVVASCGVPNPLVNPTIHPKEDPWLSLNHKLGQTLLVELLANSARDHIFVDRVASGPLEAYWPNGASHVHALRLEKGNEGEFLIAFTKTHQSPMESENWQMFRTWWCDLNWTGGLQARVIEDAVFATQGRVHMATQHELAALLTPFDEATPWSADTALAWWPNGVKARHFVKGGLYLIKPERRPDINLRERLQALMNDFLWQLAARRGVAVHVTLPDKSLRVQLPPEVIEQPLINLVDNATKSVSELRRRWGQVRVSFCLDTADTAHPLVMRVEDDGHGLTPDQMRNCLSRAIVAAVLEWVCMCPEAWFAPLGGNCALPVNFVGSVQYLRLGYLFDLTTSRLLGITIRLPRISTKLFDATE